MTVLQRILFYIFWAFPRGRHSLCAGSSAYWHKAAISSSNSILGADTTVTITISPSVDIPSRTMFTFTGFEKSLTKDTSAIPIYGPSNSKWAFQSGIWSQAKGSLILKSSLDFSAFCEISFSFVLSNPMEFSSGSSVQVVVEQPSIAGNMSGTALAAVWSPGWIHVPQVSESSNVRNTPNILTFAQSMNVTVLGGSTMTISGMFGAHYPRQCNGSSICIFGKSAYYFNGLGSWESSGTLKITVSNGVSIPAGTSIEFQIQVTNPDSRPSRTCILVDGACTKTTNQSDSNISINIFSSIFITAGMVAINLSSRFDGTILNCSTDYEFTTRRITENHTYTEGHNILYFVLVPNFRLNATSTIMVEGLINSGHNCRQCNTSVQGESAPKFQSGSVYFDAVFGVLKIKLLRAINVGENIAFEISILNGEKQDPITPWVSATGNDDVYITSPMPMQGSVLSAGTIPIFETASIKESSSIQGAANSISIYFNPGFDLYAGSKITVSGLKGSLTSTCELAVSGSVQFLNTNTGTLIFEKVWPPGDWDQAEGVLVITLQSWLPSILASNWRRCPENCIYHFTFQLHNPAAHQDLDGIFLIADLGWQGVLTRPVRLDESVPVFSARIPAAFATAVVQESNNFPGSSNLICMNFSTTGTIFENSTIAISGFQRSSTASTRHLRIFRPDRIELRSPADSDPCWHRDYSANSLSNAAQFNSTSGEITMISCERVPENLSVSFCININNSFQISNPSIPTISCNGIVSFAESKMEMSDKSPNPAGILSSNFVPQFILKNVYENCKYNGSRNMIQFFLVSNFDLNIGQIISIEGLLGSQTNSTSTLPVYGPASVFFGSVADWNQIGGTLNLEVMVSVLQSTLNFSIFLTNPAHPGSPRFLNISASHLVSVPTQPMVGTVLSAEIPAYISNAIISESSNVPGETNIISIRIEASFVLEEGTFLCIAGFADAAGIPYKPLVSNAAISIPIIAPWPTTSLHHRAKWDGNSTLCVSINKSLASFCEMSFGISLVNPFVKSRPATLIISYLGENMVGPFTISTDVLSSSGKMYIFFTAEESNAIRGEQSDVDFFFMSSIPFEKGQVFVIYPFLGVEFATDSIVLLGPAANDFVPCSNASGAGIASSNMTLMQICFRIRRDAVPWESFNFTIKVQNPAVAQSPVILSIRALEPFSTDAFLSRAEGVFASSDVCRLESASVHADFSLQLSHFMISLSPSCTISPRMVLEIDGLNQYCSSRRYLAVNVSRFRAELNESSSIPVHVGILEHWDPHHIEQISIWCTSLTLDSTLKTVNISVKIYSETDLRKNTGYCSTTFTCIPKSVLVPNILFFPTVWLNASVTIRGPPSIEGRFPLGIYVKPAFPLPASTTFTIDVVPLVMFSSEARGNTSTSDGIITQIRLNPLLVSGPYSCMATTQILVYNSTEQYSFQLSLEIQDVYYANGLYKILSKQEMACSTFLQHFPRKFCSLALSAVTAPFSQCTLSSTISNEAKHIIVIFLVSSSTISANTSLSFLGFEGAFDGNRNISVETLGSSLRSHVSNDGGSISIVLANGLIPNEEMTMKIILYPPKYCQQLDQALSIKMVATYNGFESSVISVDGAFQKCSSPPKILIANVRQSKSMDPAINVANFISLEMMTDSPIGPGQMIYIRGLFGSLPGNYTIRIFGPDPEFFSDYGAWFAAIGTIQVPTRQVLLKDFTYRMNIQILCPLNYTVLQISSSSNLEPSAINFSRSFNTAAVFSVKDSLCFEDNRIQGAANNITCTFKPSFSLAGETLLTFSGFSPTSYTGSVRVSVVFDFGQGKQYGTGLFTKDEVLVFETCKTCIISSEIGALIIFELKNSFSANDGSNHVYLTINSTCISTDPTPLSLCGNSAILTSNLPIKFTIGEIYESNSVKSSLNLITIVFQANAFLAAGTFITIAGMTGSLTESTSKLSVTGPQSNIFAAFGQWDICAGKIVLMIKDNCSIPSMLESSISFWIQNNENNQIPPSISISASGPDPNRHVLIPPLNLDGIVLGSRNEPAFTTSITLENNTVQSEMNRLTFIFGTNFVILENTVLTISGLTASSTASSGLLISGPGSYYFQDISGSSIAEWDHSNGILRLTVGNGILIGERCTTTITVEIRNADTCQDAVAPFFTMTQSSFQIGPIPSVGVVFSSCTLRGYQDLDILESNPIAGAWNRINVSFRPNFRIDANSNLTLRGIVGTTTPSTDLQYLTDCQVAWQLESCSVTNDPSQAQWGRVITKHASELFGPDSSIFSIECVFNAFEFTTPNPTCAWNSTGYGIFRACGGVLLLRTNADIERNKIVIFSFNILNPVTSPGSVLVSIATDTSVYSRFRSSILHNMNPPSWIKMVINGSSSFIGDNNEIAVHLSCTSLLLTNQKIYVGGLMGSATASGPVRIKYGFERFDSKGDWNQLTGTITVSLSRDVNAREDIIFLFSLQNPLDIRFNKNRVYAGSFPNPVINQKSFTESNNILDSAEKFYWKECLVESTSFVSGAENVITVNFTPSTILPVGSSIWLDGFDVLLQTFLEVTHLQEGILILSNIGVDQCKGAIAVNTAEIIYPNTISQLRIVTENPSNILGVFSVSIRLGDFNSRSANSLQVCNGNVSVRQLIGKFITSRGEQMSRVVGAVNRIQLLLRPSEKLAALSTIIVAGLNVSQSFGNDSIRVEGPAAEIFGRTALWNHTDKTLMLIVQRGAVVSNILNTSIVLVLRNPGFQQQGVQASVRAKGPFGLIISESVIDGPMLLHSDLLPAWEDVAIMEETRVQLAANTVTVRIQTNCVLDPGVLVTLSGFDGINVSATGGFVPIFGKDASCWSGNTAIWDECSGFLILKITETCPAYLRKVEFKFLVMNGRIPVPEKHIYIEESTNRFGLSLLKSTNLLVSDAHPAWVKKELYLSNLIPGALNTFTFTLLANFRVTKGSRLVLNGIYGTSINSDFDFNISESEAFFEYLDGDPDQNLLVINSISSQTDLIPFSFSISTINRFFQHRQDCFGSVGCNISNINIILAYRNPEGIAFSETVAISERTGLSYDTYAQVSGNIKDSSNVLGEVNELSLSLVCNIDLPVGTRIILEGFSKFFLPSTRLYLSGPTSHDIDGSSAEWNQGKGAISLNIGTIIRSTSVLNFGFSLLNKDNVDATLAETPITAAIYARTFGIPHTFLEGLIGVTNESVTPTFTTYILIEENKVPCALNQMSFKLRANFPLKAGRQIWIEGLTGSVTYDAVLPLSGEGSSFFNFTALWIRKDGTLIFTIMQQIDPFVGIDLNFTIRNPKNVQPAREPTVATTLVERMYLRDNSGSPCGVLSASEGPYVSFQLVVVGQSVMAFDVSQKRGYIRAISFRLEMSLVDVFVDLAVAYSSTSHRIGKQDAVEITFRAISEPNQFASLIEKIARYLPTDATVNLLQSKGIIPVFDVFLLSPPSSHFQTIFEVQAFESTSLQGSLNSISLQVRLAAPISVGGFMYIGRVPPNQSPSSVLELTGNGSQFFSTSSSLTGNRSALWNRNDQTLTSHVIKYIPASLFEITFVLRNSALEQNYPSFEVLMIDSPVVLGPVLSPNPILNSEISVIFVECEITEGSRSSGQSNPLFVRFRASGPLPIGTIIEITGLNGVETPSSSLLPIFGRDSDIFENYSSWFQENGTLALTVSRGMQIDCGIGVCTNDIGIAADQRIQFDFTLINPLEFQRAQNISIRAISEFFSVKRQEMVSTSCSYVWCGARTFLQYLSLLDTTCFGTFCYPGGLFQIDQNAPKFTKPLHIINSTSSSLYVEVFVSKVAMVKCLSTPFLKPNITIDLLLSGTTVVPHRPGSEAISPRNQEAPPSVLRPSDYGIAEISELQANTIYRLFCFAKDLEIPSNQMALSVVRVAALNFLSAIDLNFKESQLNFFMNRCLTLE